MDIAVNLVESYLRLNGYLTLSEFEVQGRSASGGFETITDVDIVALRLPGPQFAGDPHGGEDCGLLLIDDPLLELSDDLIDVIVGEVKQGEAHFNPGIRRHEVLHSVLHRVEWLYGEAIGDVVAALKEGLIRESPARAGGQVRTRLVAFGRSESSDLHTISHTHMIRTILEFFSGLDEAFKSVQFRDPAPAMLSLLLKTGFDVTKG
jgi:hypothetical protein